MLDEISYLLSQIEKSEQSTDVLDEKSQPQKQSKNVQKQSKDVLNEAFLASSQSFLQ